MMLCYAARSQEMKVAVKAGEKAVLECTMKGRRVPQTFNRKT
jgi:hypothetical protein